MAGCDDNGMDACDAGGGGGGGGACLTVRLARGYYRCVGGGRV